jgi:hypothetical protein
MEVSGQLHYPSGLPFSVRNSYLARRAQRRLWTPGDTDACTTSDNHALVRVTMLTELSCGCAIVHCCTPPVYSSQVLAGLATANLQATKVASRTAYFRHRAQMRGGVPSGPGSRPCPSHPYNLFNLGLFVCPDEGGSMFLRNVGMIRKCYMMVQ